MNERLHLNSRRAAWSIDEQALAWLDAETHARLLAEQSAAAAQPSSAAAATGNAESKGSIAIISLRGMITPRPSGLLALLGFGGGGLEGFRRALRQALTDEEVGLIVLNIDSPGGLVDLVPETAAEVREARGAKPIVAVANTMAASAAYYLASQADEVVVTPSGMVGSIGVVIRHDDLSGRMEQLGVKTTLIHAGQYKVEGNPFEPLSKEAKQALQGDVDELYGMFVADVAAGRNVDEKSVREGFGQGRVVLAQEAVSMGLADKVASLEETIAELGGRVDEEGPAFSSQRPGGLLGEGEHSGAEAHAIPSHHTSTDDTDAFHGAEFKRRIQGSSAQVDSKMREFSAWESEEYSRPKPKVAFKFGHHMVSEQGDVGAASVQACLNGIEVLNGARGGTKIPSSDRQGVYDHLARHLRDAGKQPPPLKRSGEGKSSSARRRERRQETATRKRELTPEQHRRALDAKLELGL